MSIASESLSLNWFDYIVYKVVSKTSETRFTLDKYDVEYMLNLYEAIELDAYFAELGVYNTEMKRKEEETRRSIQKYIPRG